MMFKITNKEKKDILRHRAKATKKRKITSGMDPKVVGKKIKIILKKSSVPPSKKGTKYRQSAKGYQFKYDKPSDEIIVRLFGAETTVDKYQKELDTAFKHLDPEWLDGQDTYIFDLRKKVTSGLDPIVKETGKKVRNYFKNIGLKVKTKGLQNTYIQVYSPGMEIPASIRHLCIDIVYGKNKKRDKEKPRIGNIDFYLISMLTEQWQELMATKVESASTDAKRVRDAIIKGLGLPTSTKKWLGGVFGEYKVEYRTQGKGNFNITFRGAKKGFSDILKAVRKTTRPLKVPLTKESKYNYKGVQIWYMAYADHITLFIGDYNV